MNRFAARFWLLIFLSLFTSTVCGQAPAPHVENAAARTEAGTPGAAHAGQHLFGAIPLSTRSVQARSLLEQAVDNYENAIYRESAVLARRAAEADPQSALAHAMLSFAARRIMPDAGALEKAKTLLPRATPDEQLLVRWMTSIQDHDLLPAISSMNDLLKRYPRDKHILYMTAEWLYLQEDDDRARSMMEAALQIDPKFPAVLNRPVDGLDAKYSQALIFFWEGRTADGRKALAALAQEAAGKKEPNAQFEIALGSAMLAADSRDELTRLNALSAFLEKPLAGMSEADRDINRANVLRERARIASLNGRANDASEAIAKLKDLATSSRDLVVTNAYESARGYLLFQQGDLFGAADELAADPHSPLALQQLAFVQDKLGNLVAAKSTRLRLKYQRAPTVEWFLVMPQNPGTTH